MVYNHKNKILNIIFALFFSLVFFTGCKGTRYIVYQPKLDANFKDTYVLKDTYKISIGHFNTFHKFSEFLISNKENKLHLSIYDLVGIYRKCKRKIRLRLSIWTHEQNSDEPGFKSNKELLISSNNPVIKYQYEKTLKPSTDKFYNLGKYALYSTYIGDLPQRFKDEELIEYLKDADLIISNITYVSEKTQDTIVLPPIVFEACEYRGKEIRKFNKVGIYWE